MTGYSKYNDRFVTGFNPKEYVILRLKSGRYRLPITERNENSSTIKSNNEFDLYFKIPVNFTSATKRHLFILIHGFDEIPIMQNLYWSETYSIKTQLPAAFETLVDQFDAKAAVVLFPIPFHHWRRPVVGDYQEWTSSKMILFDPLRLYLGFNQLIYDLDELMRQLQNPVHDRYNTYFLPDTMVHLIGYSLGGLAALSYFLAASDQDYPFLSTCHLLASGVDLRHINCISAMVPMNVVVKVRTYYHVYFDSTGFEPQIEKRITEGKRIPVYSRYVKDEWKNDIERYNIEPFPKDELIMTLFDRIVLGHHSDGNIVGLIDNNFRNRSKRIHYYLPEKDVVNNYDFIESTSAEGMTINRVPIKGCGHFLFDCKSWQESGSSQFISTLCENVLS